MLRGTKSAGLGVAARLQQYNGYCLKDIKSLKGASSASATVGSYNALTHAGLFGGTGNFAWEATIAFNAAIAGSWSFRASPDFGRGGAIFLDGVARDVASYIIWNSSYSNAASFPYADYLWV
jgi:hypothetical protein